jgi:hypothetical protein
MILLFSTEYKTDIMDVALIHTVRRFAIDPDKIAIAGRRSARAIAMRYGIDNLNVFSRIAAVSASVGGGGIPTKGIHPYNKTTEFLVEAGIEEAYGTFKDVQELRRDGHPVKQIISLINIRYVGGQPAAEDYDFLGRWLQQSWTRSEARPAPSVLADPLPLLTTEVLDKMSDFWNMFGSESVSNDLAAHNAHRREVVVPVGQERPSVWMPDMPALAAQYPSIAANLERVGLTAQQEEAYRVAIISARATRLFGNEIGTVDPTSVLAKNVEVMSGRQQGNYFPLLDR